MTTLVLVEITLDKFKVSQINSKYIYQKLTLFKAFRLCFYKNLLIDKTN